MDSRFAYRRGSGLFLISGQVLTDATAASIAEIFKEIDKLRHEVVKPEELANARETFAQSLTSCFETTVRSVGSLSELFLYRPDLRHFRRMETGNAIIGKTDIKRLAENHIDPDKILVVVVGAAALTQRQLGGLEWECKAVGSRPE